MIDPGAHAYIESVQKKRLVSAGVEFGGGLLEEGIDFEFEVEFLKVELFRVLFDGVQTLVVLIMDLLLQEEFFLIDAVFIVSDLIGVLLALVFILLVQICAVDATQYLVRIIMQRIHLVAWKQKVSGQVRPGLAIMSGRASRAFSIFQFPRLLPSKVKGSGKQPV